MLVDKLQVIEDKFMDLEQRISDPEVIACLLYTSQHVSSGGGNSNDGFGVSLQHDL